MKKLFATLLAATMVAGMSVSAFANVPVNMADKAASNDAYTLEKKGAAYKDNGDPYPRMVEGGDKIYYPILVAGDEIDDKNGKADEYYYATKASEVEDLKVTLKDVRGGKYIKGAKIVRQNLNKTSAEFKDSFGDYTAKAADVKAEIEKTDGVTATVAKDLVGGKETKTATANNDITAKKVEKVKVNAKYVLVASDDDATTQNVVAQLVNNEILITVTKKAENGKIKATEAEVKAALDNKKDDFKAANIIVNGAVALEGAEKEEVALTGITAEKVTDLNVLVGYKQAAPKKENPGAIEAEVDGSTLTVTVTGTNKNAATPDGKIYCVEVELGDYFGTKETEVEFDLTLRTRSKQYETKDDGNAPRTSFDLGEDAKEAPELKDGARLFENGNDYTSVKFRNNELTLGINKYTRSVKLDEAKKANNDVEDIERIFLEGDDFNFEVKASDQDELYLEYNQDAIKKVVVANPDAHMDFFNFPGRPEFDFTGLAQFDVEDPDKSYYFYEIVDDKPVKTTAKYNKEDECFELRTRTLGSYVISDKELKAAENPADKDADKPATDKPTTETPVNPTTPGKNVPTGAIA